MDGRTLARNYKEKLSGFPGWEQAAHASDYVLLPGNMGESLSIDESMHQNDLFTFLSNKDGHGRKGTLIAAVRGTRVVDVTSRLMEIQEADRLNVKEVTMDFSDSMYNIVRNVFPNAMITVDCFHLVKRACDGLDEMRMRLKREAVSEMNREKRRFDGMRIRRKKANAAYRKKHPLKSGETRGRKKGAREREVQAGGAGERRHEGRAFHPRPLPALKIRRPVERFAKEEGGPALRHSPRDWTGALPDMLAAQHIQKQEEREG